jgi:hypothetical protein
LFAIYFHFTIIIKSRRTCIVENYLAVVYIAMYMLLDLIIPVVSA